MLTLVLTRHGLTDRSTPEQHLGQRIDVSINDAGRRQAEALARRLAPVTFDRVITSPLFRARETASILVRNVGHRGGPAPARDGLRRLGRADVRADRRVGRRASGAEWEAAPDTLACPGGESGNDVAERVRVVPQRPPRRAPGWHAKASFRAATSGWGSATPRIERPMLVVAHSTTNRILICVALAIEIREFRRRIDQDQANLTVLRWDLDAAPDEGADARPQRHRAPAAGRRGALVLGVRPRVRAGRSRVP